MQKVNNIVNGVILRIKSQLNNGVWKPGQQIPSEYTMAKALGVSRSSVHVAIQKLVELKILDSYQGLGTFVHEYTPAELKERLERVAVKDAFNKIIEFRLMFEPEVCRQIAPFIPDRTLDELDESIDLMLKNMENLQVRAKYDSMFHRLIIEAFGNDLITRCYDMIYEEIVYNNINYSPVDTMLTSANFHRRIAACLRAHDGESAATAMRDHLLWNTVIIPVHNDGPEIFSDLILRYHPKNKEDFNDTI